MANIQPQKVRRQSPIKGGRDPLPSCVLKEIRAEVTRIAAEHNVSRSWVIATVLAEAFRIGEQVSYDETRRRRRRTG